MGYNYAIQSVENVAKAVIRLSRFMRSKFYQDFKDSTYDSNNLNLEYFEKWLAKRLTEMLNPIAAIIQTCENTKKILQTKIRTINTIDNNIAYSKCLKITVTLTHNNSTSSVGFVTKTIIKFHFVQKLKIYCTLIKLKLLKIKNCFNSLSNTHLISKCKYKISRKIDGCKKQHHTILHPPNPPATNPPATYITTGTKVHRTS